MIEIKNLTKDYKSSFKHKCRAINDITLTLPDTGMIFVVGKSGSGKSTLLNMIGSLDNITSGDVVVDGLSLSKSKDSVLQQYRSSYLGFIFQDFLLLNEFTVRENIDLALNISDIEDNGIIKDMLKKVDLEEQEDKFVTELSGGQKQRVAIARALVTNPKIILCDEPTGNLDYLTSDQILKILKKESHDKLVVVVSHNLEDAEKYADRIIELFDGQILTDKTKDPTYINEYEEHDEFVILPHHKDMTSKEVDSLNKLVKVKNIEVRQNEGGFKDTEIVECGSSNKIDLQSGNLSLQNSLKLSQMFFRKNKHGVPYTILILMLCISLLYIFQVFVLFDGNTSMTKPTDDEALRVVKLNDTTSEGSLSTTYINAITDDEIQAYYDAGYEGNIYKTFNYGFTMGMSYLSSSRITRYNQVIDYIYAKETTGTICCDENFIKELYAKDGELKLCVGSIDNAKTKLLITDYTADCMMNSSIKALSNYEDVLNNYSKYVCGIIDTGYKEKYKSIINKYNEAKDNNISSKDFLDLHFEDQEYVKFLQEVQDYLSLCYTLASEEDFYEDVFVHSTASFQLSNFYAGKSNEELVFSENASAFFLDQKNTYKLADNEIILSYSLYNSLFNKEYSATSSSSFEPHKLVINRYSNITSDSEIVYSIELNIVSLGLSTYVNKTTFNELEKARIVPYSLYFDNVDDKEIIYEVSTEQKHLLYTLDTSIVPVVNTIIELFKAFCYVIIGFLVVASFIYIIIYGINSIKRNIYEIGVLKALGTKSINVSIIFLVQIIVVGIFSILASIIGIIVLSMISNKLLVSAFEDFMTIKIFSLNVIAAYPKIMFIDLTIVLIATLVSSNIPLIYLKAVKPLNILKGKKK